jgi:hypothetical protein
MYYESEADHLNAVQEHWQTVTLDQVKSEMVEPETFRVPGGYVRAHILEPTGELNEDLTIVRFSEHQQPYNVTQHVGAAVTRDIVAPNSRVIMFTNNSFRKTANSLSKDQIKHAKEGSLHPVAEDKMRVIERLAVKNALLTGFSLGGVLAAETTAVGSDKVNITHLNIDEAPSKTARTAKQLQKDFMKSGGWGDQQKAMEESRIPAFQDIRKAFRLGPDYAKFGIATLLPMNKAIQEGMRGTIDPVVYEALHKYPGIAIKIGSIAGSRLFDPASIAPKLQREVDMVQYEGDLFHAHASVNNPFIQAAMVKDCIRR